MKKEHYEDLLLQGYLDHKNFYEDYISNRAKKLNDIYGISSKEFFFMADETINRIIEETISRHERLIKELKEGRDRSVADEDIEAYNKRLQEVCSEDLSYGYNVRPDAQGLISDKIYLKELNIIKDTLSILNAPKWGERDDFNQSQELYNRVFKSNFFELFELLFDEFNIDESKRADLKFIFEMMKEDGFLHPEVSQREFYECISRVYNMDFQITSNWSKTKHRTKIYSVVKENFKKK